MEKTTIQKKSRNSSIELLRIISVMGVIVLHYNNKSMGGAFHYVLDGSVNYYYLLFTEASFIGAVNIFIIISAYFLSATQKRSFSKIVELFFEVICINAIFYFYGIFRGGVFSFGSLINSLLPRNYYVLLYCALYIISPYINLLLNNLERKMFRKLLITTLCVFSVWNIIFDYINSFTNLDVSGLSTISMIGSLEGYTIVNFILMYLLGAYIRRFNVLLDGKKVLCGILVFLVAIFSSSLVEQFFGCQKNASWNYNNPFVIGLAVCVFLYVLRFDFSSKIINELSKATFTCFLLNGFLFGYAKIPDAVNKSILYLFFNQLCLVLATFLLSYIVYKIYSLCTGWFFKLIKPFVDKVNISEN